MTTSELSSAHHHHDRDGNDHSHPNYPAKPRRAGLFSLSSLQRLVLLLPVLLAIWLATFTAIGFAG